MRRGTRATSPSASYSTSVSRYEAVAASSSASMPSRVYAATGGHAAAPQLSAKWTRGSRSRTRKARSYAPATGFAT
ncbi:hypothetical protein [Halosegnis marinus]|uniref:hypothetical protein n=1 Tax=Halosegnis marinus TaxID=3034023 RepID=UPI00361AAC35